MSPLSLEYTVGKVKVFYFCTIASTKKNNNNAAGLLNVLLPQ